MVGCSGVHRQVERLEPMDREKDWRESCKMEEVECNMEKWVEKAKVKVWEKKKEKVLTGKEWRGA